jgi:hypothetical protein
MEIYFLLDGNFLFVVYLCHSKKLRFTENLLSAEKQLHRFISSVQTALFGASPDRHIACGAGFFKLFNFIKSLFHTENPGFTVKRIACYFILFGSLFVELSESYAVAFCSFTYEVTETGKLTFINY